MRTVSSRNIRFAFALRFTILVLIALVLGISTVPAMAATRTVGFTSGTGTAASYLPQVWTFNSVNKWAFAQRFTVPAGFTNVQSITVRLKKLNGSVAHLYLVNDVSVGATFLAGGNPIAQTVINLNGSELYEWPLNVTLPAAGDYYIIVAVPNAAVAANYPALAWVESNPNPWKIVEREDQSAVRGQFVLDDENFAPGKWAIKSHRTQFWHSVVLSSTPTVVAGTLSISVSPAAQTVTAGSSTTATVSISGTGDYSGKSFILSSNLPSLNSGLTVSWGNTTVTAPGSTTLTIQARSTTPAITESYTITARSASSTFTGDPVTSGALSVTVQGSAPQITTINPLAAPAGALVELTGKGFGAAKGTSQIIFGTTAAAVTSWADNRILVTVPAGAASGSASVTVGTATTSVPFIVTTSRADTSKGPASSTWPMARQNARRTGQATVAGPSTTPNILWTQQIDPGVVSSPAIGPDGTLYFGSTTGKLYAINPASGAISWIYTADSAGAADRRAQKSMASSPAVAADGTVYIGGATGLHAVKNGVRQWLFPADGLLAAPVRSSPLIAADGSVLFGSDMGILFRVNSDGSLNTMGAAPKAFELQRSAALHDGSNPVLHLTTTATDARLDPESPQIRGRYIRVSGTDIHVEKLTGLPATTPVVDPTTGVAYFATSAETAGHLGGRLYAVRTSRHATLGYLSSPYISATAVAYTHLALGSSGTLYALTAAPDNKLVALTPPSNLETGTFTQKWTYALTGASLTAPLIDKNGTAYVISYTGTTGVRYLQAIDTNGTLKWKLAIDEPVTWSSPAIGADGNLYFASESGKVYAVGTTPSAARISLNPESAVLNLSGTQVFTATALDQYGNALATQPTFTWSLSGGGTLSITGGRATFTAGATSSSSGKYTITATAAGSSPISGSASISISPSSSSLSITPKESTIIAGSPLQLTANGVLTGGDTVAPLSSTWTVDGTTVATNVTTFSPTDLAPGAHTITATSGSLTDSISITVIAPRIEVTPKRPEAVRGGYVTLTAWALDSRGHRAFKASNVTWSTSAGSLSTASGSTTDFRSTTAGSFTVTATLTAGGVTATDAVRVNVKSGDSLAADIKISAPTTTMVINGELPLSAETVTSTGATVEDAIVTWGLNGAGTISSIRDSDVIFRPTAIGTHTITARMGAFTDTLTVTVTAGTLKVLPENIKVAQGQNFTLFTYAADASSRILGPATGDWTIGEGGEAIIESADQLTLNAAGPVNASVGHVISAASGSISGSTTITILDPDLAITSTQILPAAQKLMVGHSLVLGAYGVNKDGALVQLLNDVTWTVEGSGAVLSHTSGPLTQVTSTGIGTITVKAARNGTTVSTTVIMSVGSLAVNKEDTTTAVMDTVGVSLAALDSAGNFSHIVSAESWSGSANAKPLFAAGEDIDVLITDKGTSTVTATFGGQTASTTITSTYDSLVIHPNDLKIETTGALSLTLYGSEDGALFAVTPDSWSVTNGSVVSGGTTSTALVQPTGAAGSTMTVRATVGSQSATATISIVAVTGSASVHIIPRNTEIVRGREPVFYAHKLGSNGGSQGLSSVTWILDGVTVATGSSYTPTTTLSLGSHTLQITSGSLTSDSTSFTVAPAEFAIDPFIKRLMLGEPVTLQVWGFDAQGTRFALDNPNLVTWSYQGTGAISKTSGSLATTVTPTAIGSQTVHATLLEHTAFAFLDIVPKGLRIDPSNHRFLNGQSATFRAYALNTADQLAEPLYAESWGATGGGSVSQNAGESINFTTNATAEAVVLARWKNFYATAPIVVTEETSTTVTSLSVSPSAESVAVGRSITLTLYGLSENGIVIAPQSADRWEIQGGGRLSQSSGATTTVEITALGAITVTATKNNRTVSTTVTGVIDQVRVLPSDNTTIQKDKAVTYSLYGVDANGNLIGKVSADSWTLPDGGGALSAASGSDVTLTASGNISTTPYRIIAARGALSDSGRFTIAAAGQTTTDIAILPKDPAVEVGNALTVTSYTANTSTQSVIDPVSATWTVTGNATLSSATGSSIQITPTAAGTITLEATSSGFTDTITLTSAASQPTAATLQISPSTFSVPLDNLAAVSLLALDAQGRILGEVSADSWTVTSGSAQLSSAAGPRTTLTPSKTGSGFTLTAQRGSLNAQSTFTVTAATAEASSSTVLAAIQVDPSGTVEIPAGTSRQFRATGVNAASLALNKQPTLIWSTTGNNSITSNGVFTAGDTAGDFTVIASAEGTSGAITGRAIASVTVTPPPLSHIVLTPSQASVNAGESVVFTAEGRNTREYRVPKLTYTWTVSGAGGTITPDSSDSGKATLSAATPGRYTVTSSAEGVQGTAILKIEPKAVSTAERVVSRLEITPGVSDLLMGETASFTARAYNATGREVTGLTIPWSVQSDTIGQIDSQGTFVARAEGRTTIIVDIGSARATANVTVRSAPPTTQSVSRIVVDPQTATVNLGQSRALSAAAYASDGSVISHPDLSWSVTGGGSISQNGLFRATEPGVTTVKVTSGSIIGTALIHIPGEGQSETIAAIELSPGTTVIAAGTKTSFETIVRDGSGAALSGQSITWSVNGGGTISSSGELTAQSAGTFTVTATSGETVGTATVTVAPSVGNGTVDDIVITNPTTLKAGTTATLTSQALDASGNPIPGLQTVVWSLSGGGDIQKSTGAVEAKIPGDYTVSVTTPSGATASAPLTILPSTNSGRVTQLLIKPADADVAVGEATLFTATGFDENGKIVNGVAVTWSLSGAGIITSAGLYSAPTSGGPHRANVIATFGDIVETYPLTVRAAGTSAGSVTHIVIPNDSLTVKNGQSITLQAVPKDAQGQSVETPVTWSASGGGSITSSGTFTASTPGIYEVVATSGSTQTSALISIPGSAPQGTPSYVEVSVPDPVVQVGEAVQLTPAVKTPQGQTLSNETVTWSATGSGTVNSQGVFTAVTPGITTVTAASGSVIGTSILHVVEAGSSDSAPAQIVIGSGPLVLTLGNDLALTAAVLDENKKEIADSPVTWVAPRGGTISEDGVFSASESGTYTIRGTAGAVTQTVNVTVAAPTGAGSATHLVMHQSPDPLVEGNRVQFSATPMDAQNNPIAQSVTWQAPAGGGVIDNTGLFTPTKNGAYVITAKAGDVTQAIPVSIAPSGTPQTRSAAIGEPSQIEIAPYQVEVAVGQPITLPAVVKDPNHFVIPEASVKWAASGGGSISSTGTFTPTTPGTYTVSATSGQAIGSATVNVISSGTSSGLVSTLTLPVQEISVLLGKTFTLTALAQDANGRVIANAPVTYSVSGGGTITSQGVFSATQSGTYVIKATSGAITTTVVMHIVVDDQAPVVKIFLNDHTLKKGTFISRKPKLTILITDETGIDTGSLKIFVGGKKLSAQSLQTQVIKTQADDPTSLQVTTQITDSDALDDGKHNLRVEVSDTSGNAATASTQELVVQSGDPVLLAPPINYPNPFAPSRGQSTFINYSLNVDTDVVAYVYDITGTLVWKRTFISGTKGGTAGENEIEWTGRSDFGEFASNGAYIYFLTTAQGKVLGKGSMAVFQ